MVSRPQNLVNGIVFLFLFMMSEPLKVLDPILKRNCGARFEGDIFSVLRHSPYAIRSFEFAVADGAIDCTRRYDVQTTYAQRFHEATHQEVDIRSELLLFDVKSTTALEAGEQQWSTFTLQRATSAFMVCTSAGDPTWVHLVPNYSQQAQVLSTGDIEGVPQSVVKDRRLASTRRSWMPARAYGFLDPSLMHYRMPRAMLVEAIDCARRCARGDGIYTNPWNGVQFPKWHPILTSLVKFIEPSEETMHFTAYQAVMHVMRSMAFMKSFHFDFVGVQPRIADFRLDELFVQHKIDSEPRDPDTSFGDVLISRDSGDRTTYYFNTFERFDFLFYQFELKGLPPRRVFFFVPEIEIPDAFYLCKDKRSSFECLLPFRRDMNDDLQWVHDIENIVSKYRKQPRRSGNRPLRPESPIVTEDEDRETDRPASVEQEHMHDRIVTPVLAGRKEHAAMMRFGMRRFYLDVMAVCARRRSGLLIVLPTDHAFGNLAFVRYTWSRRESETFLKTGNPPQVAHSVPSSMACVPISYHARHRQSWFNGPTLTAAEFRRLNSSTQKRLLVFDLGGPDTSSRPLSPCIIPSEDVQPTENQRQVLTSNLGKDKDAGQWEAVTPNVSALLNSGLYAAEYAATSGPIQYAIGPDDKTWTVLNEFSLLHRIEWPKGRSRDSSKYRCSLRSIQQLQSDEEYGREPLEEDDMESASDEPR